MIGPLLEKVYVDLHFEGDYEATVGINALFVLTDFYNNFYEDFTLLLVDLTFKASEVVNYGSENNFSMVVAFKEDTPDGLLLKNHYYTVVGVANNIVKLYNPHGYYCSVPERYFYENLEWLQVSYFNNKIFKLPEVQSLAEFHETWHAVKLNERVILTYYNLVVDEDDTELLINLIFKKDPKKVIEPQIFIATNKAYGNRVIRSSVFQRTYKPGKTITYFPYSLRAKLRSGRYKVILALSEYTGLENCRSCSEYLQNGGKEFSIRLAASKNCLVEKSVKNETRKVERMLIYRVR